MKSSLKKLRNFTLSKHATKDKHPAIPAMDQHRRHTEEVDALQKHMQVVDIMREQYDSMLAAAQSMSGSSYDFSRSVQEMASCMLDVCGKSSNVENANIVSMLGKVQFEISKLLDVYTTQVSQTIIRPTERLLKEVQSVQEIKKQYEVKRKLYDQVKQQITKGRSRKGDSLEQQLSTLEDEISYCAMQFDARFQLLRTGQEHNFLTQSVRHHSAQVRLFGKGLDCLNAVESLVSNLSLELKINRALGDSDSFTPNKVFVHVSSTNADGDGSVPSSPDSIKHSRTNGMESWENGSMSAPLHASRSRTANSLKASPQRDFATYVLPTPNVANPLAHTTKTETERIPRNKVQENIGLATSDMHRRSYIKQDAAVEDMDYPNGHTTNTETERTPRNNFQENIGLVTSDMHRRSYTKQDAAVEDMDCSNQSPLRRVHFRPASRNHAVGYSVDFSHTDEEDALPGFRYSHSGPLKYGHSGPLKYGHSGPLAPPKNTEYTARTPNIANFMSDTRNYTDSLHNSISINRLSTTWAIPSPKISPCASPPVSTFGAPLISELHKLPTPPPERAQHVESSSHYSAPKSAIKPSPPRAPSPHVMKSRSIPSTIKFTRDLQRVKSIGQSPEHSPIVESP